MANAIMKYIPITFAYVAAVVLGINYVLLTNIKITSIPKTLQYIIYSSIFYFVYGATVSFNAGMSQCEKNKPKINLLHGFQIAVYGVVTYLAISLFLFFRSPFLELFGNTVKGTAISEIFYIALNLTLGIVYIYFDSAKSTCKSSAKELEANLAKLEDYLNTKTVK